MKKRIALILAFVMILSLVACGTKQGDTIRIEVESGAASTPAETTETVEATETAEPAETAETTETTETAESVTPPTGD